MAFPNDYGYPDETTERAPLRVVREAQGGVRLTRRGKVVVGIVWVSTAWTLAEVLPFWWTRL